MSRKKYRRRKKTSNRKRKINIESGIKQNIIFIGILAFGIISLLSLFNLAGTAGVYLSQFLTLALGWGKWVFPLILFGLGFLLFDSDRYHMRGASYLGIFLLILSIQSFFHLFFEPQTWQELVKQGQGGGYIGYFLALGLIKSIGFWASIVVILALLTIALMLIFNTTLERIVGSKSPFAWLIYPFKQIFNKILNGKKGKNEYKYDENFEENFDQFEEEIPVTASIVKKPKTVTVAPPPEEVAFSSKNIVDKKVEKLNPPKKIIKAKQNTQEELPDQDLKIPSIKIDIPLDLLKNPTGKPTSGDIKNNIYIIKKTFENFGIPVLMGDVQVGPTVTQYSFKPAKGVKVARIKSLKNDLALSLAAHPIRIEAPIPGKSLVGVEVPNQKKAVVSLKEILEDNSFKSESSNLSLALGKDVTGKVWFDNLAKMPHLIVAGATNSGKSVCLNTIIASLLYQNNPNELQFIMVDPKRVELTTYNGIPHLLTPVITDVTKTINALKWCLNEMDRRFDTLSKKGKRNITDFNENLKAGDEKMPYIIFIIDELADLMMAAKRDVEAAITRLAQMSRAVGIHLVLATQRPSTDVITGLIKANMPARISFAVASSVDSRTILDSGGAEDLLGQGDMLLSTSLLPKPKRIQGAYLSDTEIKKIVKYIKEQVDGETNYVDEIVQAQQVAGVAGVGMDGAGASDNGDSDALLNEAKDVVINTGKASASLLQRRLSIGYARAARIIDLLENAGVVGPANGSKPREILIDQNQYEESQNMPTAGVPVHDRSKAVAPDNYLGDEDESPTVFKSDETSKENEMDVEINNKNKAEEEYEEDEEEISEEFDKDEENEEKDESPKSKVAEDVYSPNQDKNWEDQGKFFSK